MTAYGHRRKGDCADIEDLQPPQAGAGPGIADAMQRLVPRGKTPIADSLQRVGEALSQIEDETSIVLVSDGIETCGGDPCAVAAALHGRDVKLKVHVVGYDVSADAEAVGQLRCVAEKGGGQYFPADDVAGLSGALTTITTSVVAQQPVAAPPAPTVAAVPQAPSTTKVITVAGPGTVELAPAPWVQLPPYFWKLVDPETGEPIGETEEGSLKVKPGRYQVAWRQDPQRHRGAAARGARGQAEPDHAGAHRHRPAAGRPGRHGAALLLEAGRRRGRSGGAVRDPRCRSRSRAEGITCCGARPRGTTRRTSAWSTWRRASSPRSCSIRV